MLVLTQQSQIPTRVLELLATSAGHELPLHTASEAARSVRLAGEDWVEPTTRAARRAGLKVSRFTAAPEDLPRLRALDALVLTRVKGRWLLLLHAGAGEFELRVVDDFGEETLRLRGPALSRWLADHGAGAQTVWLAVEPRLGYAAVSHAPSDLRRLLRTLGLERRRIAVVLIYGVAMAAASLAVPLATQALVNTIAATAMLQQILVLALLLTVVLGAVAVLRVLQIVAVERIHRRWWVRGALDWIRRTPQISRAFRQVASSRDLANRFIDVALLQKDIASLLLNGSSLVLVMLASLLLLAFYHPVLFAFDAVLLGGIGVVVLAGLGAAGGARREAAARWAVFAWMDDVAGSRITFAGPSGRALADARGELLLRDWLQARGSYFRRLLRHVVAGAGLEVLATVAVLAIGGWLVTAGELELGQLVAASVLVSQIGAGVGRLGRQLDPIYEGIAALSAMSRTLDAELEPGGGEILPRLARPLAVELVDDRGDVSLSIKPGERVALVGASDSHSRVLDLLYGLYGRARLPDLSARLDGHDVHLIEIESLRDQVALVRGAEVVCTSARENLIGAGGADEAEFELLLDLLELRPALARLPNGLDQMLLPDGDAGPLTDSEIRRIVLARALLARPRLLLIDLGLDRLGLRGPQRAAALDWIFDQRRPWTLVVVTDSVDSHEVLARCDQRHVLATGGSER